MQHSIEILVELKLAVEAILLLAGGHLKRTNNDLRAQHWVGGWVGGLNLRLESISICNSHPISNTYSYGRHINCLPQLWCHLVRVLYNIGVWLFHSDHSFQLDQV